MVGDDEEDAGVSAADPDAGTDSVCVSDTRADSSSCGTVSGFSRQSWALVLAR